MESLLMVLVFYYQQIALGNTDPVMIRDYIAVEALVMGVNPQIALGVVKRESQFHCERVGDYGTSHGCWQIHLPAHKEISPTQAHDVIWSTQWSLNEIKENGCGIWSTCFSTMKEISKNNER